MTVLAADGRNGWVTTAQLATLTGCSYRQLDSLASRAGWNPGSGNTRIWSPEVVRLVRIAQLVSVSIAKIGGYRSITPGMARVALDMIRRQLTVPESGWIGYGLLGAVSFGATPTEAVDRLGADAAVVVRIPPTEESTTHAR